MSLAYIRRQVDGFVRDESERLTRADKDAALSLALRRYDEDAPRVVMAEVISPGGDRLPLPDAWERTSILVDVEYPVDQSPRALLPCSLYTTPVGSKFRLGSSLAPGAVTWVSFTVAHQVTETSDSTDPRHHEGIAAYAAALLLEALSAAAINDGDSTIVADTVDRRSKAQEYASRARALKSRYRESLGTEETPDAQGTAVSWPSRPRLLRHS